MSTVDGVSMTGQTTLRGEAYRIFPERSTIPLSVQRTSYPKNRLIKNVVQIIVVDIGVLGAQGIMLQADRPSYRIEQLALPPASPAETIFDMQPFRLFSQSEARNRRTMCVLFYAICPYTSR
jgi:hypothetical protein